MKLRKLHLINMTQYIRIARCDIWSLGVILLECAVGEYSLGPRNYYPALCVTGRIIQVVSGAIERIASQSSISKLIRKMLQFDEQEFQYILWNFERLIDEGDFQALLTEGDNVQFKRITINDVYDEVQNFTIK